MSKIFFVGEHTKTFDIHWHSHDQWELVYCTGGTGTFKFENGSTIEYGESDLVAIPPKERHANFSGEGFTNIHIRMENPSFSYHAPFRIRDDEHKHIKNVFDETKYYFLTDIKNHELLLEALGEVLVSYIIVFRGNSEYSKPVEQIRSIILQNYSEPTFALDEAIRSMSFQYDYLRKLFKKEMGQTPLEYMTQMRMKKAEMIFSTVCVGGGYSVSEIAEQCGFEDPMYFSRVFKKYYGSSPSAYIKSKQEETERPTE